ncbi:hypothetical protein V8E55_005769 [Tylopilus felleus]
MSNFDALYRTPLLEKFNAPHLRLPTFSRTWITTIAIALQMAVCGLIWTFSAVMMFKKIIPLSDYSANWIVKNPSETNMAITVSSTILAMIGSYLLGVTVQHALTFRLPRGIHFSVVTLWIQLARNSLFLRPRYLWWTLLSALWLAATHFLTTAWSNLLTPVIVVQNFTANGREVDFLSPAIATYVRSHLNMPFVPPTARNYSLDPSSLGFMGSITGYLYQAGMSAASDYVQPGYPAFISQFNSSTGGVNPTLAQGQLGFPTPPQDYQGLSTSYTLTQQGYTANISCMTSSSPTITLDNSSSAEHTFDTPLHTFDYTLETWSWSTNCSGNGEYYTGEANLLTSNVGSIGNGLFATSSPNNSSYSEQYFSANPNLPVVCQVTPMVTTLEVHYNQSGLANVTQVLEHTLLPYDSWPLASIPGVVIWATYFLAQGPYSNSLADGLLEAIQLGNATVGGITPVLEQYLRGIFEQLGSVIRGNIYAYQWSQHAQQPFPDNMTVPISGIMAVQTIGWKTHPRTHSVALAVITLVTVVTVASGIYALLEAQRQNADLDPPQRTATSEFDPTNLTEVLVASSMGSLAKALSQPEDEDYRDHLMVELYMTEGQSVLNARADYVKDSEDVELEEV